MASVQKTVLITGCSEGGIGFELAEQLHAKGLRVFATARSLASMNALKEQGIETFELDVTVTSSIQQLKADLAKLTDGTLDILINNAGVCYQSSTTDDSMDQIRSLFAVNVFGVMEMTQTFTPMLIESNRRALPGKEFARIVQVASLATVVPTPWYSAYNASKAALLQYGNTLRIELEPFGVKVMTLNTGRVESRIIRWDQGTLPEGSIFTPIKEAYETFGHDVTKLNPTPCKEYAKEVALQILKKNPGALIWGANESWTTWFMDAFLPRTIWDTFLRPMFSLDKLAAAFTAEKAKLKASSA